jgi:hypothetical protein
MDERKFAQIYLCGQSSMASLGSFLIVAEVHIDAGGRHLFGARERTRVRGTDIRLHHTGLP